MSNDLARWGSRSPATREAERRLEAIQRDVQIVTTKIRGLAVAGGVALDEAVLLTMIQREAERIAPDGSERYALIVNTVAVAIASELRDLQSTLGWR